MGGRSGVVVEQILDHYYGGTELGSVDAARRITVRLTEWDGSSVLRSRVHHVLSTVEFAGALGLDRPPRRPHR